MTSTTQSEAVRFDVTVEVSAERAFRVFTEKFDQIKPREHNLLAPEPIAETIFEPQVGGHVYDRGEDGFHVPLGAGTGVRAAPAPRDQPGHLADLAARDRPRPRQRGRGHLRRRRPRTGRGRTGAPPLERHGEGWESVRDGVAEQGGWPLYLQRYIDTVAA